MQRMCSHIGLFCGIVLLLSACGSPNNKNIPKINNPVLYNPASSSLHPQLGVFHVSDVESQLYIMLNTTELLINEANAERIPRSEIKIHYELFDCTEIENNKLVSDSATFVNSVEIKKQQKTIVFPIIFPAEQGRRYLLLVQITDLLRFNTIKQFIDVNKQDVHSAQNFKVTALNGAPRVEKFIDENDIFRILYQRRHVDKLFIKYMNTPQSMASSPLSLTPAAEFVFKADSIWEQAYSPTTNFMFGYEGIYLIQTDTTTREGLLLMNFGTTFPREDRVAKLIEPIKYLTTSVEYQKLETIGDPKKMMDDFWLATTGSTDKARMLIRVFYTRMSYANQYFSDYKEGWKTDRGMIYLIYGLPNVINKGSDSETWEYSRKQSANSISFTFKKIPSPYGENYFVLQRGDPQPTYWRQAVDSWRKGKVFNIQDLE